MSSYSDLLKKKEKEWDCPDLMSVKTCSQKIPFSSPLLNWATYGGIPRKAITELHGNPGGGKTTTAIDIEVQAVRLFEQEFEDQVAEYRSKVASGKKEYQGPLDDLLGQGRKKVLHLDLEHSFDRKWAAKMGAKQGDIDVMQPPDLPAEDILQTLSDLVATGELGLVVLDSIPSLVPRCELEKKLGERTVAALAGLLTIFMRKIVPLLTRYDCTLILINQVRDNMDNPYVVNTPGGAAVKYYSTLRMMFKLGAPVDFVGNELPSNTENPSGYLVNVKVVKQKSAPFDRKVASYYLMAQSGIRPDFDYGKLAISQYGIIKKAGAWFTMCDPETGEIICNDAGQPVKVNGMVKVYDYLANNPEYYAKIKDFIMNDINGSDEVEVSTSSPLAENELEEYHVD